MLSYQQMKDLLYFIGELAVAIVAIWKIGKWTESVNSAVTSINAHIASDNLKFTDLYEKHNKLRVKVAGLSGDYQEPED